MTIGTRFLLKHSSSSLVISIAWQIYESGTRVPLALFDMLTTRFVRDRGHWRNTWTILLHVRYVSTIEIARPLSGVLGQIKRYVLTPVSASAVASPCRWPMNTLSTRLIHAYTGLNNSSALPPFAFASQTARNPPPRSMGPNEL